jgi:hypothetical protein
MLSAQKFVITQLEFELLVRLGTPSSPQLRKGKRPHEKSGSP